MNIVSQNWAYRSSEMLASYIFFPHHVTCVTFIMLETRILKLTHVTWWERKYMKLAFYYYGITSRDRHGINFLIQSNPQSDRSNPTIFLIFYSNLIRYLKIFNLLFHTVLNLYILIIFQMHPVVTQQISVSYINYRPCSSANNTTSI